jgi:hypothetical protein
MANESIHDRGRGPEVKGTRITVYNLLPHFLYPTATEAYICRVEEQTTEVSSCRGRNVSTQFPTFKEWMAERESQPSEAS